MSLQRALPDAVGAAASHPVETSAEALAASFADRVLMMTDGELVEDLTGPSAAVIAEKLGQLS